MADLKRDAHGNIVTYPMLGWDTAVVAESAALLVHHYSENVADIDTGGRTVQLVMTPQQCVSLAEALNRLAQAIERCSIPGKPS